MNMHSFRLSFLFICKKEKDASPRPFASYLHVLSMYIHNSTVCCGQIINSDLFREAKSMLRGRNAGVIHPTVRHLISIGNSLKLCRRIDF
jgi:hypothetical protein